jgi:hypothetical protein
VVWRILADRQQRERLASQLRVDGAIEMRDGLLQVMAGRLEDVSERPQGLEAGGGDVHELHPSEPPDTQAPGLAYGFHRLGAFADPEVLEQQEHHYGRQNLQRAATPLLNRMSVSEILKLPKPESANDSSRLNAAVDGMQLTASSAKKPHPATGNGDS